jgi:hypothetical protein
LVIDIMVVASFTKSAWARRRYTVSKLEELRTAPLPTLQLMRQRQPASVLALFSSSNGPSLLTA